jgi:hypothetical protein
MVGGFQSISLVAKSSAKSANRQLAPAAISESR